MRSYATPADPTAYHEAGHAVAGVALRLWVIDATIDPSRYGTPRVRFDPRSLPECGREHLWRRHIVASFAGPLAQRRIQPSYDWTTDPEAGADRGAIGDLIFRLGGDPDRLFVELQRQADRLLDRNWPAVERVAVELMRDLYLMHRRIYRLVRRPHVTTLGAVGATTA